MKSTENWLLDRQSRFPHTAQYDRVMKRYFFVVEVVICAFMFIIFPKQFCKFANKIPITLPIPHMANQNSGPEGGKGVEDWIVAVSRLLGIWNQTRIPVLTILFAGIVADVKLVSSSILTVSIHYWSRLATSSNCFWRRLLSCARLNSTYLLTVELVALFRVTFVYITVCQYHAFRISLNRF